MARGPQRKGYVPIFVQHGHAQPGKQDFLIIRRATGWHGPASTWLAFFPLLYFGLTATPNLAGYAIFSREGDGERETRVGSPELGLSGCLHCPPGGRKRNREAGIREAAARSRWLAGMPGPYPAGPEDSSSRRQADARVLEYLDIGRPSTQAVGEQVPRPRDGYKDPNIARPGSMEITTTHRHHPT